MTTLIKLPKLMEKNSVAIQIAGSRYSYCFSKIQAFPNRAEVVQVQGTSKIRFYASDGALLLESGSVPRDLPTTFGLVYKCTTASQVDFKTKSQSLCVTMKPIDILNNIESITEIYNYDE